MSRSQALTFDQVNQTIIVHLQHTAHAWEDIPSILSLAQEWCIHLYGRGYDPVPLCLMIDLGILLSQGDQVSLRSQLDYESWMESERGLRLRYEAELVLRLSSLPQVNELIELGRLGALPQPQVLRALELICKAFIPFCVQTALIHPSHLRELKWERIFDKNFANRQALSEAEKEVVQEAFNDQLSELLKRLSQGFSWSSVLSEADLFELRNWSRLHREDLRIGCRQLIELSDELGVIQPTELVLMPEDAQRDIQFRDDTTYPTGGITELTTSGSWENLVLSELIYIDDTHPAEVDLFDIRFVENEILFYLRDEGQLSSMRRSIDFIIDLGPFFNQKLSGNPYQFSILVEGLIYCIMRDLNSLYSGDALLYSVYLITGGVDQELIRDEIRLLEMLLSDEIQRGKVAFHLVSEVMDEDLINPKRKRYAQVFTWSDQKEEWSTRLQRWSEAGIGCSCLSLGGVEKATLTRQENRANDATYHEIKIPYSGMVISEIKELKTVLTSSLVSARLKRSSSLELNGMAAMERSEDV